MTTKFIVSTALGIGAIGGTAGIGYWYSQPKNLKELLVSEGIKLLDVKGNATEWEKLAKKHTTVNEIALTGGNKVTTITDLGDVSGTGGIQKLKDKCQGLFKQPITKDSKFETSKQNAKDWCSLESPILKEPPVATTSQGSGGGTGGVPPLRQ